MCTKWPSGCKSYEKKSKGRHREGSWIYKCLNLLDTFLLGSCTSVKISERVVFQRVELNILIGSANVALQRGSKSQSLMTSYLIFPTCSGSLKLSNGPWGAAVLFLQVMFTISDQNNYDDSNNNVHVCQNYYPFAIFYWIHFYFYQSLDESAKLDAYLTSHMSNLLAFLDHTYKIHIQLM